MNSRDAASGLGLAVTGLFLQASGFYVQRSYVGLLLLGALLYLVGTGLLLTGLIYHAMAKGRSPAWGVMAFFSVVGLFVLVALKDIPSDDEAPTDGQDAGEKMVVKAADLDFTGQWDEAVAMFEAVLQEPKYQEHHIYARNCIERIRQKQGFARGNG